MWASEEVVIAVSCCRVAIWFFAMIWNSDRCNILADGRFQDGASTANNPSGLALQEALRLWPHTPVDCLVSLGSGSVPVTKREKSMSAYLDTGSVLIESACNVERIAAVLYTLAPFIPDFKYYRSASSLLCSALLRSALLCSDALLISRQVHALMRDAYQTV